MPLKIKRHRCNVGLVLTKKRVEVTGGIGHSLAAPLGLQIVLV
ncbi:hypothetical protein [Yersinia sp. 2466 StPb PI]